MSWTIENERLRVTLADDVDTLSIRDLRYGGEFRGGRLLALTYGDFYHYELRAHTAVRVEADADAIRLHFDRMNYWARFAGHGYVKPDPGPALEIDVVIRLEGDRVVLRIEPLRNLDDEPVELTVGAGLNSWSSEAETKLLMPFGYGVLFHFPRHDVLRREFEPGWGYSVPVYGFYRPDGGLMTYLRTPFDLKTRLDFNQARANEASVVTSFRFDRHANYARELHWFVLPPGAGYVGMAKRYREVVREEGRLVTLAEKIAASPEVEKLVGTVVWKHHVYCRPRPEGVKKSYSLYMMRPDFNEVEGLPANWTAQEVFDTAHRQGFDRVCVYNTGWQRHGFDKSYPTRFPVNEELGDEAAFTAAAEYGRSLSPGYVFSVHDNYFDTYRDSVDDYREDLIRNEDGSVRRGGIWRGGRTELMCTHQSLKYARRDLPRIARMVGRGSIYLDVIGNARPERCFHPDHPQGSADDVASRRELFRYAKAVMGSVATEGVPNDYYADVVDMGAFAPLHDTDLHASSEPRPVPVPFWQLIYHDCVLNYISEGTYGFNGSEYRLYVALFGFLPTQFDEFSKTISFGLRESFRAEMTDHEFLMPPRVTWSAERGFRTETVARTRFADGTVVVANFSDEDWHGDEGGVPARDFRIFRKEKGNGK